MIGRNDLCPCGSGKKYKKCCLAKDEKEQLDQVRAKQIQNELGLLADFDSSNEVDNTDTDPFPDLEEEEKYVIEKWWEEYDEINEDPSLVEKHIWSFLNTQPAELADHLYLEEEVIFEMGADFKRSGEPDKYIDFLFQLREKFPQIYQRSGGYYENEIISWLVSKKKAEKAPDYFTYLIQSPENNVEQLFDTINLLMAKDLIDPLIQLIQQTKDRIIASSEVINGEDIFLPLIYYYAENHLKPNMSKEEIMGFIERYKTDYPNDIDYNQVYKNWEYRLESIFKTSIPWPEQTKVSPKIADQYFFEISDHFMAFLKQEYGLSWVSAQYHSDLIDQLGRTYREIKKGKMKRLFEFDMKTFEMAIEEISSSFLWFYDGTMMLSSINILYYFAIYLNRHQIIDDEQMELIQIASKNMYETHLPELEKDYMGAYCFSDFPFWAEKPDKQQISNKI